MDKNEDIMRVKRVETSRSGFFIFQLGVDFDQIHTLLQRVEDAHKRFASVPILPEIAKRLTKEVVVSSVFGTNTIEGGTLSEEETAEVINTNIAKEEKDRRVLNIKNAYAKVEAYASLGAPQNDIRDSNISIPLQESIIKELHGLITNDLTHQYNMPKAYRNNVKGQLTKVGDNAHGGVYTPLKDIEKLMQAYLAWINSNQLSQISPLIRAPLAHYYFERIHPFWDGNGRVGRVIEAMILISAGYRFAPFELARFYLENIDQYFSLFNVVRKSEENKEPFPNTKFVSFFLEGMLKVLNKLHDRVDTMIGKLLYESSLTTKLHNKNINIRQFTIINNLLVKGLEHDLSSIQTQFWYKSLYEKLNPKARTRDLKRLEEVGLIHIIAKRKLRLLVP